MEKVKFKYTIQAQLLRMLRKHATTALMFALIWLIMISLWATTVGSYIFAALGTLGYFFAIYNEGCDSAIDDKKPYSPLTPKPLKGLYLPVLLTVINILIIIIYKCSWHFGATDGSLTNAWGLTGNVISILWFCMYKTLLGMDKGHFELQGYLIIVFLPYIASFLGYYAGYKGYDIYGKINSLAYEKSKKKKK